MDLLFVSAVVFGEGNGTPLQYFCLENPMDGGRLQSMGSLEWDTTERLHFHFSRSCIGEGNGNPLQCSFLENPMDRGAWQATVHGVTKSRTRLSDFTLTFHFHALEKEMATHSSVLAWRTPGMAVYGVAQSQTQLKRLSSSSSRQEYWSRLPFPSPGYLPNPRIEPTSAWQANSLPLSPQGSPT